MTTNERFEQNTYRMAAAAMLSIAAAHKAGLPSPRLDSPPRPDGAPPARGLGVSPSER